MNSRPRRNAKTADAVVRLAAITALLLSGAALAGLPAHAQSAALPRADVVEQLDAQYAEAQTAVGVTQSGGVVEVFASKDGSTWTLVLTKPDGTSRVIAAGETWVRR